MVKSKKINFDSYKISLITITQWCRKPWLDLLFRSIHSQTAKDRIIDWVIVDGSKKVGDQHKLKEYIQELTNKYNLPVSYYQTIEKEIRTIGWLRNYAHTKLKPETTHIIVCDDDDYQMKTRVQETIKLFEKDKNCNLIGTNSQYLYDYDLKVMFRFKDGIFGENHSVNSCLSYRMDYIIKNKYDDTKERSEEPSFLNDFKNKMSQLDPNHSIVGMSYGNNTYNKAVINQQNIIFSETSPQNTSAIVVNKTLKDFMGKRLEQEYLDVMDSYEDVKNSPYDITYYSGFLCPPWNPTNKGLGGSESAIVNLSREWVKQGLKVEVYCYSPDIEFLDSLTPFEYEGVHYYHTNKFKFSKKYNNLILWRYSGLTLLDDAFKINANKVYVDLHDHNVNDCIMIKKYEEKIDKVFYKSNFHSGVADHEFPFFKEFSPEKRVFIQNGLELETFQKDYGVVRDKYRFQYSSSYFRGLRGILKYSLPIIFKNEPRFELHVYYGMDVVPSENEGKEMRLLLSQEGVIDHGRQGRDIVAREKQRAMFHLYPTNCVSEICCISLKESMASGCIPIISDVNIFSTFAGAHIKWDVGMSEEDYYKRVGESVLDLLKMSDEELKDLSEAMKKNEMIKSWEQVAKLWIPYF